MTDLRQAAMQALEALELSSVTVDSFGVQQATQKAITAIRTALAVPEPKGTQHMTIWPFPLELPKPMPAKPVPFNPNNHEDAPW
jgi:hypothetical protein